MATDVKNPNTTPMVGKGQPFIGLVRFRKDLLEERKNQNLGTYHSHFDPKMSWDRIEQTVKSVGGEIDQYFYLPGGIWDLVITGTCQDLVTVGQLNMALEEDFCTIQPVITGQDFRRILDKYQPHQVGLPAGTAGGVTSR